MPRTGGVCWINARSYARHVPVRELNGVADLMRWEILYNEGGFVVDADSVCRRPLEPWLFEGEAMASWENELVRPGLIAAGYVATVPENPFIGQIILDLQNTPRVDDRMAWQSVGPLFPTERPPSLSGTAIHRRPAFSATSSSPRHFTGTEYAGLGPGFRRPGVG